VQNTRFAHLECIYRTDAHSNERLWALSTIPADSYIRCAVHSSFSSRYFQV